MSEGGGVTDTEKRTCVTCHHDFTPTKRTQRFCCGNCRTIDNRLKREDVTRPLRAIAALLGVRMTLHQALDILDRQGLAKVARWLALWGFQWTNGCWAVQGA